MARNIHQRRAKNRKADPVAKTSVSAAETLPPAQVAVVAESPAKRTVVVGKGGISQEVMDARVAELPWELKRIALFSACVVVLLIVLWFILR
jgi:hypothetical protein